MDVDPPSELESAFASRLRFRFPRFAYVRGSFRFETGLRRYCSTVKCGDGALSTLVELLEFRDSAVIGRTFGGVTGHVKAKIGGESGRLGVLE